MSDQVIFTKEEVEKIREVLQNHSGKDGHINYDTFEAMFILDSPRPRPKVPISMLQYAASASLGLRDEIVKGDCYDFARIIKHCGFDVED